jgi:hypothetical protein
MPKSKGITRLPDVSYEYHQHPILPSFSFSQREENIFFPNKEGKRNCLFSKMLSGKVSISLDVSFEISNKAHILLWGLCQGRIYTDVKSERDTGAAHT